MTRMSNRDRIARAAEEARLAEEEKAVKKKAKATKRPSRARSKAKDVRMKIIWTVHDGSAREVRAFAYPDKQAAEAEAQRLSGSTGQPHEVRATKVPME